MNNNQMQKPSNSLYNTVEFGDRKIQISGSVIKFYVGRELIRAREVKDVNFAMEEFQQVAERYAANWDGTVIKSQQKI